MRAYPFGDARLFGNYLAVGKAEVRFPIGSIFGFPPLRGMAAFDYGTLFNKHAQATERITSSFSAGFGLNFPPITMGFIFTRPIKVAPGPRDTTVFHFLLRYLYL
jgi:outer membrane protein assembly factor BamA